MEKFLSTYVNGINVDVYYEIVGSAPNKEVELISILHRGYEYVNRIAPKNKAKLIREIGLKEMIVNPFED